MTVFHNVDDLNKAISGPVVVAIGNFDGVHQGHRDLFMQISSHFNAYELIVITFRPHPIFMIDPSKDGHLLQTYDQKLELLNHVGIKKVLELDFTQKLKDMSSVDFCNEIILKIKNLKAIGMGYDFSIGKDFKESKQVVKNIFENQHLEVLECNSFHLDKGPVSSSKIRNLVLAGKIEMANTLLGRNYNIGGKVIKGKQIGRDIGFPTANIELDESLYLPKFGVYKVKLLLKNNHYYGMLNIGYNPTVSESNKVKVECHILDFDKDIYGDHINIEFLYFVRDEMKFNSLSELVIQIKKDIAFCRKK